MAEQPARALRLSQAQRIKHRRDFDRARSQGRRVVQGCLIVNWFELPGGAESRLGVITPKKLGGAVLRTRCRRLMREVFRLHQGHLARSADIILVARASMVGKMYAHVEADFIKALKTASLWKPT